MSEWKATPNMWESEYLQNLNWILQKNRLYPWKQHVFSGAGLYIYIYISIIYIQIHFLDCPDTFYIVQKLSSSSGHFAYYLDTLYSIRRFFKLSGKFSANGELVAKTFRICKNFPGSNASLLTRFLRLSPNLTLNYIWVILRCWGNSSILCQQNSDAL